MIIGVAWLTLHQWVWGCMVDTPPILLGAAGRYFPNGDRRRVGTSPVVELQGRYFTNG
jgi:hypothetical protein